MEPWAFQNLQGLPKTLKPRSSHQQLAFVPPLESSKAGFKSFFSEQSFSAAQGGLAGLGLRL